MLFQNRLEAGVLLGNKLLENQYENPVVFAMPRGGLPVGFEVAKILSATLELAVVRKLGLPTFPEYGFGAIAPNGVIAIDETAVSIIGINHAQIEAVKKKEEIELARRIDRYQGKTKFDLTNNTAILIDDGIATGVSALAALRFLKQFNPAKLVVAAPVCSSDSTVVLSKESDDLICLYSPIDFSAVGQFYQEFEQTSDEEVIKLMEKSRKNR